MVSVVMPTYNRAKTIERAIFSILNQSYQDFEIIIVDDNSNDNTEEIVKNINDNRIKYIKNNINKGANESRNIGIAEANGEYIAFQDSDDEWMKNKLEVQLKALSETNSDVVASGFFRYEDDGTITTIPEKPICDEEISKQIMFGNFISTQTVLGKKQCFLDEKFDPDFPRMQDWDLMIRISRRYKVHYMNTQLANVYIQGNSISKDNTKGIKALNMFLEKYKDFYNKNPKAKSWMYYEIGNYHMRSNIFDKNYYLTALKYDKLNIKSAIKAVIFQVKKIKK